jgi:hypothetical protein
MCHPWPSHVCQPLVRARLANVVGDVTWDSGSWDFGSSEDLGCSIVEGCSNDRSSMSNVERRNVQRQSSIQRQNDFRKCRTSIVDCRMSKCRKRDVQCRTSKKCRNRSIEWPRPRGEIWDFREYVCSKKRGVQHRTPKTPTNNARITSGGNNLQTRAQILVW